MNTTYSALLLTTVIASAAALPAIMTAVPAAAQDAQQVTIGVWSMADINERYRVRNIELAAQILNEEFKIQEEPYVLSVESQTFNDWGQMKQAFSLAAESGSGPNIIVSGHEDIPVWGQSGIILPVEDYVDLAAWPMSDIFPNLWEIVSWNGKVWGIPQDAESRPFFGWIPHYEAIGYSAEDVATLPQRIIDGDYTLRNILEDAKKMQDAGLVEAGYGFYPRPSKGGDYWQFYAAFGGRMYDEETGKLVLDTAALLSYYQFFHDAVFEYGVTKKNMIGTDWDQWYAEVTNGKAGIWHGGTWHYARYTNQEGLTDFFDKVVFGLIPAGDENGHATTLTHPLTYLISARNSDDEAYISARLVEIATEPRLNTLHAIASAHLAVARSQLQQEMYASDRWASEASALLPYAFALPNNADFGQYDVVVWNGLSATWSGESTPQEAVDTVVAEIQATMGDAVIID